MHTYSTRSDAIEREILPALGSDADDFDLDAIFEATFEWHVEHDAQGRELLDTAGFRQVRFDGEFWDAVAAAEK